MSIIHLTHENQETIALQYAMKNNSVTNDNMISDMKRALHMAVKLKLTHRQREILFLYYYEDKTMPEIAIELGIAKQNVSKNIQRAITNIKKYEEVKKYL